ncbi:MAG: family peptidase [Alphaproteobacteria bacterium]|nr:family peptidase [Alphaproteobacteria bacterium]
MSSELAFSGGSTTAILTISQSPRAKVMRLRVDPRTGEVSLTVPRRVSHRSALAWAAGHRAWVEKALAEIPPPAPLQPGASVPLYGTPHLIDWEPGRPRTVSLEPGRIRAGGPLDTLPARITRWLREQARLLLEQETHHFAARAGVTVTRVGVGDPLSRWGSCSSRGSIRYSWRLILAPDWVRRATVAHEVAHRVHLNHGRDFHDLVEQLLESDPSPARLWLRRHGAALHRFGRG